MDDPTDSRVFSYRIDAEGNLTWVNDEWLAFARENGSSCVEEQTLGHSLWAFIADAAVHHLYTLLLDRSRRSGERVRVPYRCDSPDCRRYLEMEITALSEGQYQFDNRIVKLESRLPVSLLESATERSSEFLSICSWCKKIRTDETSWDEVEEAVSKLDLFGETALPNLTHGACPDCKALIYRTAGKPD